VAPVVESPGTSPLFTKNVSNEAPVKVDEVEDAKIREVLSG
jgi:hypothetical protein